MVRKSMGLLSLYIFLIIRAQSDAIQTVEGLISRLFGNKADAFVVQSVNTKNDGEYFTLSASNGKILIQGHQWYNHGDSCAILSLNVF
eukprot:UN03132